MSIGTSRTPQEYEVLTGGGAETAEMQRAGLTRRQVLRRGVLLLFSLGAAEGTYAALTNLYPNLAGQFGAPITLKAATEYHAAAQHDFALDQKGVFYEAKAKSYIMHLADPNFLIGDANKLQGFLDSESWVKDQDGSYWLALYQVCVHLGCKVPFRDDCNSFKCPCHGSHYNIDGEYIDGPAPRSLDRFTIKFDSGNLIVDTGTLNQHVERPDDGTGTRILPKPAVQCSLG